LYCAAVSWLALRTSVMCPSWLIQGDAILPWLSTGIFGFSLLAPFFTLIAAQDPMEAMDGPSGWMVRAAKRDEIPSSGLPELSPTELLRARGLLAIGFVACIFAPDSVAFALGSQEWWGEVRESFPSQTMLESSTALYGLFAVEASMLSHRVGKAGVAPFNVIVPSFAVVCFMLAIIPCVFALQWLGDDISFFSYYLMGMD